MTDPIIDGKKEYVTQMPANVSTEETGFEECQVNCTVCGKMLGKLIVKLSIYPLGIDGITRFLENNGARNLCVDCYAKTGLVPGPLDKVRHR
jgi:hypothetical protein